MSETLLTAALVTLTIVAAAVSFFIGRSTGSKGEIARQALAKATAEETAKRIVGDAEREAESSRKGAVLAGKEEVMRLREAAQEIPNDRYVSPSSNAAVKYAGPALPSNTGNKLIGTSAVP